MKTRSAYFTTNDGVRLHYLEAGRGTPLVLLPGWTQPAEGFSRQIAALAGSLRCLALDFRGHGASDRPDHGYRVARLARDCLDFLDHLGLEDAVLLGHSAGCVVIWSFIDLFGEDRVRALVLCDEPIAFLKRPGWSESQCREYGASAEWNDAVARALAIAGPDGERVLRDFLSHEFGPELPESEVASVIEGSLRMPRGAAAELMLSVMQADFRDLLPRIHRPTLCIGGRRSHLGPAVMPWIASRIPHAQLAMIDARHFVHLENPDAFNSAVRGFCERLLDVAVQSGRETRHAQTGRSAMVEQIPDLPANVLGFTAKGTVTANDYESVIIPAVEAIFARQSRVRFLYHLGEDFSGFEPAAMWDDTKLGLKHLGGWERMAVVCDVEWIRAAVRIFGLAMPGHVRVFHDRELAEAKRWISE